MGDWRLSELFKSRYYNKHLHLLQCTSTSDSSKYSDYRYTFNVEFTRVNQILSVMSTLDIDMGAAKFNMVKTILSTPFCHC